MLELVGFQLVWWVAAFGAASGAGALGIAAATAFVALQTWSAEKPVTIWPTAVAAGAIGLCVESLFVALGLVRYAAAWPSEQYAPAWIVALWTAFGTTLRTMRRTLGHWPYLKGTALGAALGPASYLAGAGLGALDLGEPLVTSLLSIAVLWAFAMLMLLLVLGLFEKRDQAGVLRKRRD